MQIAVTVEVDFDESARGVWVLRHGLESTVNDAGAREFANRSTP